MYCGVQGIQMQPVTVTQFQDHIFNGRWEAALALLPQLTYDPNVALQASPSLLRCAAAGQSHTGMPAAPCRGSKKLPLGCRLAF